MRRLLAVLALLMLATPLAGWDSFSTNPTNFRYLIRARTNPTPGDTQTVVSATLYIEHARLLRFHFYANNASILLDSVLVFQVSNNDTVYETPAVGTQGYFTTPVDTIAGKDLKTTGGKDFMVRTTPTNNIANPYGVAMHRYARVFFIIGQATTVPNDSIFCDAFVYQ